MAIKKRIVPTKPKTPNRIPNADKPESSVETCPRLKKLPMNPMADNKAPTKPSVLFNPIAMP